jgi:hypothetical protein
VKQLEDGTYLASIELPRSADGKDRSLMIRLYPKTQTSPLAIVALDYEIDGAIHTLSEKIVHGDVFNELVGSHE